MNLPFPEIELGVVSKRIRYEKPPSLAGQRIIAEDISKALPTSAAMRGWHLRDVESARRHDPVVLYDAHRRILHEWPYVPSLTNLFEVVRAIEVAR